MVWPTMGPFSSLRGYIPKVWASLVSQEQDQVKSAVSGWASLQVSENLGGVLIQNDNDFLLFVRVVDSLVVDSPAGTDHMTPATAIITGTLSKARERTSRKNNITQHKCSWMCVTLKHLPGRVYLCRDVDTYEGRCLCGTRDI